MTTFLKVYTAWTALTIVATMIFLVFPIVYLCNGNKIMPYALAISYVIWYSINILVSTFFVYYVFKVHSSAVSTYKDATKRLALMVYMLYIVDYVFNVASMWGWLDNNKKYMTNPDGQSPLSPSRDQAAFFSLFSYSGGSIYVKIFVVIYGFQLFTNLYDTIGTERQPIPSGRSKSETIVKRIGESKTPSNVRILVFTIAGAIFFAFTFVYVLIFFIVAFKINTAITLTVLVNFLAVMSGSYLVCIFVFFFYAKENLDYQKDAMDVVEITRQVNMMFYFFAFYLVINWIFFIDAWVLTGPDSVDFSGRLPHLINTDVKQPLFFYTFVEGMAPINAGALLIVAYYFITFSHSLYYMWLSNGQPLTNFFKFGSKYEVQEVSLSIYAWVLIAVSWASVIVIFGFVFAAFAGNFYMAVHYQTFVYTFTAIGFVFVAFASVLNYLRVASYYDELNPSSKATQADTLIPRLIRQFNVVYLMSLFRSLICVPLYYILAIIIFYISNSQYELLGSEQISQWLIRAKLNGLTVEAITFYWPEIILVQFVLVINLTLILIDSTVNNTILTIVKKNK